MQVHCLTATATAAKSHELCLTLCDPIDSCPPGSHPWDSPGKHTGVGCHFLLQCMKVKGESEVAQSLSNSSRPHGLQPTRLLHPWDFPGKTTGVGCHCLLNCLTRPILYFVHSKRHPCTIPFASIFFPINDMPPYINTCSTFLLSPTLTNPVFTPLPKCLRAEDLPFPTPSVPTLTASHWAL